MSNNIEIRRTLPSDGEALEALYPAAFPDEDLLPVVRALLREEGTVLSFAAMSEGALVGHIVFTLCNVTGQEGQVALLGPLAVSPKVQKQGIGSALIQEGFRQLKGEGVALVYVLGDPAYYSRHGFKADGQLAPPYALPQEWQTAWQSINLQSGEANLEGTLIVPKAWQDEILWQ